MNVIDLFSGLGGFSYALHNKIRTIAYCDISNICRETLKSVMNKGLIDSAPIFDDVRTLSADSFEEVPNMITGGFPCQDISLANPNGKGLDGDRSSLFFEIIRLCDEIPSINHVFLENVSQILKGGMIERVYESFISRGFYVSHVIVSARNTGAPHTRKRCYIMATRNMEELSNIRLEWSNTWTGNGPPTMARIENTDTDKYFKRRCCMSGNSVVPACVSMAYNFLVHGEQLVDLGKPVNIVMQDGETRLTRPRWGTPYASFHLYHRYKLGSVRSGGVLINQVWYNPENIDKRDGNWSINPVFVEWLMGYPEGYTQYNIDNV